MRRGGGGRFFFGLELCSTRLGHLLIHFLYVNHLLFLYTFITNSVADIVHFLVSLLFPASCSLLGISTFFLSHYRGGEGECMCGA